MLSDPTPGSGRVHVKCRGTWSDHTPDSTGAGDQLTDPPPPFTHNKGIIMFLIKRTVSSFGSAYLTRQLSTRATPILSSLGISTTNEISGVYDGRWRGSGDVISSVCPTTGEILARVKTATPQELHEAIARTREAYTFFRSKHETCLLDQTWLNASLYIRCSGSSTR